jgi:hypothetical protein
MIYIPTRQLEYKLKKKTQHVIAMISMIMFSGVITFIYHTTALNQMLWESLIFWLISNVVYVLFADSLYTRMDNYLDKKLGED